MTKISGKTLTGIVVVVLIIIGIVAVLGKQQKQQVTQQPQTQVPPTTVPTVEPTEAVATGEEKAMKAKAEAVTVAASGFSPKTLTVKAGTKVSWTNKSGTTVQINSAVHPTHLIYPPLNLGVVQDGASVSLVFDKPGTYKYHNHLDVSQTGTVVVE